MGSFARGSRFPKTLRGKTALNTRHFVAKLPAGPNYGQLRLQPEWDYLRDDPRFEKIVASLAPK
jgi:hypothetical protein